MLVEWSDMQGFLRKIRTLLCSVMHWLHMVCSMSMLSQVQVWGLDRSCRLRLARLVGVKGWNPLNFCHAAAVEKYN